MVTINEDALREAAGKVRDLNLQVDGRLHLRFKLEASVRGLTAGQLLEKAFEALLRQSPSLVG